MSWTEPLPVVHEAPVEQPVIEEIVQMLGYEPRDVAAVFIEAHTIGPVVRVIERQTPDRSMLVEHRHAIL